MTATSNKILNRRQKALFVKYYPLVKKIVNSMRGKLPTYADTDELHSAGVQGLADAILKLDPSREDTFGGYVSTRIRGAIIDELRNLDYMSRSARNDAKSVERIRTQMEQHLGRKPLDSEVREEMGVSQKQFDKIMRRTQTYSFMSLNDPASKESEGGANFSEAIPDENATNAVEAIESKELAGELRDSISKLPEKQRRVLQRYYFEEKKLGEIAKEFGLTEARICQIHSQALNSLRPKFKN